MYLHLLVDNVYKCRLASQYVLLAKKIVIIKEVSDVS